MHHKDTAKYIGMATQFIAALSVAFFVARIIDGKLATRFPFFTVLLPLAVIIYLMWKIYKDTTKK